MGLPRIWEKYITVRFVVVGVGCDINICSFLLRLAMAAMAATETLNTLREGFKSCRENCAITTTPQERITLGIQSPRDDNKKSSNLKD